MSDYALFRNPAGRHWYERWLYCSHGTVLHRVVRIKPLKNASWGPGKTVCGFAGTLDMPGVLSRLGMPRCKRCCRVAGVPDGAGNPYNHHIEEPRRGDECPVTCCSRKKTDEQ